MSPEPDPEAGPAWRLSNPRHLIALGFGAGLAPKAPGTFGTLVGIVAYLLVSPLSIPLYLAVVVLALLGGIWLTGTAARDVGVHDHPAIVWDEVVGYLITMIGAPDGPAWIVAGFVLFRIFDIAKPWPIHDIDRKLGGGAGIMLDDALAGLFALAAMQALAASAASGWFA